MVDPRITTSDLPTLRVAPAATRSIDPEVAARFTPGAVVEVTVQRQPNTPDGILVDGKFVAASIPPDLTDGSEIAVQVVRTAPAIVLRVVSLDPTPLATRPATLLDEAFRILLSGEELTELRDSFRGVERSVGQSLTDLTKSLTSNRSTASTLQELARQLGDSIAELKVIDDPVLNDPAQVATAIERAITRARNDALAPSIERGIRDTTTAVERLAQALGEAREIPTIATTVERLREEIGKLLNRAEALGFGATPTDELGDPADSTALATTARSIAITAGRTQSFADIVPRVASATPGNSPLAVFLRALGALHLELSHGESPLQHDVGSTVRQLLQTLNRIPAGPREDAEVRAALTQAAQRLDSVRAALRDRSAEATLLVNSADISTEIERIIEGQDILRSLAPVARSFGEPVALFIPAVVHGLLTKFEFAFHPPPPLDNGGEEGSSSGESQPFERIDLKLPLPALGPVHVAVARRPGEALINITCESALAHTHLEKLMPKLEEILDRLGYEKRAVVATVGAIPTALPEWCRTITRSERVA